MKGLDLNPRALFSQQSMIQGQKGDRGTFSLGQGWVWGSGELQVALVPMSLCQQAPLMPVTSVMYSACYRHGRGIFLPLSQRKLKSRGQAAGLKKSHGVRPELGSCRGPRLILIQISGSCMLGEPFLCWVCPLTCPEALVPDLLLCFAPDQLCWGGFGIWAGKLS